jgi:hypothetical protein
MLAMTPKESISLTAHVSGLLKSYACGSVLETHPNEK